jgi:branched-chain amino acid transport system ATP-binding protein
MDILRLDEVSFAFGALCVTNKVSLVLPQGRALGVIGPNGAGKSTLLDLITGTKRAASGRIHFMGQDVTATSPQVRSDLGIARSFQIPRPFLGLTVYENVLVGATHGGRRAERPAARVALRVLEQTGLIAHANELASSLRLLDRKRLELARALATEPKLLLLDEVAGGLSDMECQSFISLLRDIRDGGTTMIWIEHIVHALTAVVSHLFVLDQGAQIAEGAPASVLADPKVRRVYLGIPA